MWLKSLFEFEKEKDWLQNGWTTPLKDCFALVALFWILAGI
ncbi:40194_t:CDS:2 [Gigaspora margarita]|uniref:40194_t:CDS:1 n=1 Tax=Gigaspora margarita TaxID=4874 RepID=A0ABN7UFT5_GIGMA|nr:40194_t:CDS:2 [Gigaspora margarita]